MAISCKNPNSLICIVHVFASFSPSKFDLPAVNVLLIIEFNLPGKITDQCQEILKHSIHIS
jgi:hypothetical protein